MACPNRRSVAADETEQTEEQGEGVWGIHDFLS